MNYLRRERTGLLEEECVSDDTAACSGRHWIGGKRGGKVCLLQGFFFGAKIISAMIRHIFSCVERSFTFGDHASVPPIFANLYQTDQSYTKLYQAIPSYTKLYQTIPNYTKLYQTIPNYIPNYQTIPH